MVVTIYNNDNLIVWGAKGTDRIIQNAKNIIRTKKFEVPFMRGMGLNPDHTDSTVNQIKTDIEGDIIETLRIYEPRASVLSVKVESVDENGKCVIAVEVEV